METFGTRLRELRRSKNITQGCLAEKIGVVASAVGKYETQIASYPNIDVLLKIADFFNVSTDYLLRGTTDSNSVENVFNGQMCSFVQANQGGIVYNNQELTPETVELINIYKTLNGRNRLNLINYAISLEGGNDS